MRGRDSLTVCLGWGTNTGISQPDVVTKATLLEGGIEADGNIDMRSDVLGKVVLRGEELFCFDNGSV